MYVSNRYLFLVKEREITTKIMSSSLGFQGATQDFVPLLERGNRKPTNKNDHQSKTHDLSKGEMK
ncbi:hypothetical protein LguiA_008479 [Lonicera macranthoides]